MEETMVTVIGMFIAIIIMFIVPMILIADTTDDISELVVQTATAEFVDDVIKTGKITSSRYAEFLSSLTSSGNTYEVDMEVKILDENTAKAVTDVAPEQIGNNTYYSLFTSQIEEKLWKSEEVTEDNINNNVMGKIVLKQGDGISVTVRNNSATFSQTLKSFYYTATGADLHIISASASGTVAIDGRT